MAFMGGSLAWAWTLVNTWTGRANSAWGPSRAWNSGASFETNYNSEVGLYNASQVALAAMTTDRNNQATALALMTTNYNNEVAAYNAEVALLAASVPAALTTVSVGLGNFGLTGTFQVAGTITLTIAGYWLISFTNAMGDGGSATDWAYCEIHNDSTGGTVLTANVGRMRWSGVGDNIGNYYLGNFAAGTVIRLYARVAGSGNWTIDGAGHLVGQFIPTPAQPH